MGKFKHSINRNEPTAVFIINVENKFLKEYTDEGASDLAELLSEIPGFSVHYDDFDNGIDKTPKKLLFIKRNEKEFRKFITRNAGRPKSKSSEAMTYGELRKLINEGKSTNEIALKVELTKRTLQRRIKEAKETDISDDEYI